MILVSWIRIDLFSWIRIRIFFDADPQHWIISNKFYIPLLEGHVVVHGVEGLIN
jgi:hypothetical protein